MKRIVQLDFFRGFFLLVMTAHHFMTGNNILNRLTNESIGWVSAGEGFFFLSGLTAGIVYGRLYMTKGQSALRKATAKRLRTIYLYHVAVASLIVLCIYSFTYMHTGWSAGMPNLLKEKTSVLLLTPFLLYLPPFLDILPVYLLFFTVLPFAVRSFFQGKAWHVFIPSFLIYSFGFLYVEHNNNVLAFKAGHMPNILNPFCWQFLFLFGVYTGYLFYSGTLKVLIEKQALLLLALLISIVFLLMKVLKIDFGLNMSYWANGGSLGPLRLLNFCSLSWCVAYLCSRFKSWFAFKPVCFLGRYSLEVFTLHVAIIYFLCPALPHLNSFSYAYGNTRIYPLETFLLVLVLLALFTAPYMFLKRKLSRANLRTAFNQVSFFKI